MLISIMLNMTLGLYILYLKREIKRIRFYKNTIRFLMVQLLSFKRAKKKRDLSLWMKIRIATRAMMLRKWQKYCFIVDARTLKKWVADIVYLLFRWFWHFLSGTTKRGRRLSKTTIAALRRLISENPRWGGVRLWSQMLQLGFKISLRSVYNYKRKYFPRPNLSSWWDMLEDAGTLAIDFCVVPTVATFFSTRAVYLFIVIENQTRKILYLNTTENPTTEWVKQQFRNAELDGKYQRIVMDNDSIFSQGFADWLTSRFGWKVRRTAYRAPWQNAYAERWIGSIRRELFHRQAFATENGVRKAALQYVAYYNRYRPHSSLMGKTPNQTEIPPAPKGAKLIRTRHFGLENSYHWALPNCDRPKAA